MLCDGEKEEDKKEPCMEQFVFWGCISQMRLM